MRTRLIIAVSLLVNWVAPSLSVATPQRSAIVDGTNVPAAEYPSVGALYIDGNFICSGTLVAPRFFLTAAHCFHNEGNRFSVLAQQLSVVINGDAIPATKIHLHPQFVSRSEACLEEEFDAALVELTQAPLGVSPVGIVSEPPAPGQQLILVGYGFEGAGKTGENGELPLAGTVNVGRTTVESFDTSYLNWRFDQGESNTASGDSGGPSFVQSGERLELAGITCGGDEGSRFGGYSYNTRADRLLPWVMAVSGSTPSDLPPGIIGKQLFTASVGRRFSAELLFTGGAPLEVSITGLPPGVTYANGSLQGVPTQAGSFVAEVQVRNAVSMLNSELRFQVLSFIPKLTVQQLLLQFDSLKGTADFLYLTGTIQVGRNFSAVGKTFQLQSGRFRRKLRLNANGYGVRGASDSVQLSGLRRSNRFRGPTVSFTAVVQSRTLFDSLSTLGFPISPAASRKQKLAFPLSITLNGVTSTVTLPLSFRPADQRWGIAP